MTLTTEEMERREDPTRPVTRQDLCEAHAAIRERDAKIERLKRAIDTIEAERDEAWARGSEDAPASFHEGNGLNRAREILREALR